MWAFGIGRLQRVADHLCCRAGTEDQDAGAGAVRRSPVRHIDTAHHQRRDTRHHGELHRAAAGQMGGQQAENGIGQWQRHQQNQQGPRAGAPQRPQWRHFVQPGSTVDDEQAGGKRHHVGTGQRHCLVDAAELERDGADGDQQRQRQIEQHAPQSSAMHVVVEDADHEDFGAWDSGQVEISFTPVGKRRRSGKPNPHRDRGLFGPFYREDCKQLQVAAAIPVLRGGCSAVIRVTDVQPGAWCLGD